MGQWAWGFALLIGIHAIATTCAVPTPVIDASFVTASSMNGDDSSPSISSMNPRAGLQLSSTSDDDDGALEELFPGYGNPQVSVSAMKEVTEKVTVCVKTFERPSCAATFVKSFRAFYPEVNIILMDDSRSEKQALLRADLQKVHKLTIMSMEEDAGLSAGRNECVRRVKTPYFLLVDDDFVATPWLRLDVLLAEIERGKSFDIVGACNNDNGVACRGKWSISGHGRNITLNTLPSSFHPPPANQSISEIELRAQPATMVANFFIANTQRILEMTPDPWDAALKVGEHEDFFLRAASAGLSTAFTDQVQIDHVHACTLPSEAQLYKSRRSRAWKFLKMAMTKHKIQMMTTPWGTFTIAPAAPKIVTTADNSTSATTSASAVVSVVANDGSGIPGVLLVDEDLRSE